MKKILALLLALCLLAGYGVAPGESQPVDPSGDEKPEKHVCGDYTYRILADGTAELVGMNPRPLEQGDPPAELTVPAELDGIPVTVIGEVSWWYGVKKVIIPEGVTTLRGPPSAAAPFGQWRCRAVSSPWRTALSRFARTCGRSICRRTIPR